MYLRPEFDVEIRDSAIDPARLSVSAPIIFWRGKPDRPLYKVWLYLEGRDVPFVRHVTYRLHPTFTRPVRQVTRSLHNPNCQLVIWTWGIFPLSAEITDREGNSYELTHTLSYNRDFSREDVKFVRGDNEPRPRRLQRKKRARI